MHFSCVEREARPRPRQLAQTAITASLRTVIQIVCLGVMADSRKQYINPGSTIETFPKKAFFDW